MSKYIDADKLIAEIERRREKCADIAADEKNDEVAEYYHGKVVAHDEISSFITSLQQEQPKVDLEKEYKTWWNSISDKINVEHIMEWYMHETARHFYELGLNARK